MNIAPGNDAATTDGWSLANIHCEACARRVTRVVQRVAPDHAVDVDITDGRIALNPPVAPGSGLGQSLLAALAEAGYPRRPQG